VEKAGKEMSFDSIPEAVAYLKGLAKDLFFMKQVILFMSDGRAMVLASLASKSDGMLLWVKVLKCWRK